MEYDFKDDRLHIMRTVDEKKQLLQRLNRIEGQVGGLRDMIENDRYSGDEIQQASAITAAVREVALMLIAQQLEVGVDVAAGTDRKAAVEEMRAVLRLALGQTPGAFVRPLARDKLYAKKGYVAQEPFSASYIAHRATIHERIHNGQRTECSSQ